MYKPPKRGLPTIASTIAARIIGLIVAPGFVVPALYYNLDWMPSAIPGAEDLRWWGNLWAAFLIVGSAVVAEGFRHTSDWGVKLMAFGLALLLVVNNSTNAFENLSKAADHSTDHRKSAMVGAKTQSSGRSEWSAKVDAAKAIVGDKLASTYKSELEQYQQQNAKRWNDTKGCELQHVTSSKDFCKEVARLRGLLETAEARDAADAKVREIDRAMLGVVVPSHADPFAANVSLVLGVFGIVPTQEAREGGIRAIKSLIKTVSVEAMATFGPTIWLAFIAALVVWIETPRAIPVVPSRERAAPKQDTSRHVHAPTAVSTPAAPARKATPEFDRFCTDELEAGPTYMIDPTPVYQLWCDWCRRHGKEAGSMKKFGGMMGEKFKRDANHGYPRYLEVRARPRKHLQVVASNP